MFPDLRGKGLFVFSDPGGAKPLLALLERLGNSSCLAVSDTRHPFYKDFTTSVEVLQGGFDSFIKDFAPEYLVTGTSYTSDIEKYFMRIAAAENIVCYSFVDHWTRIRSRFELSNSFLNPSQVWVVDERAKNIAVEEGIDYKSIVVTGNPYHEWLKSWSPQLSKKEYLRLIGVKDERKKLLVYAPDPLSNVNGICSYGFDEFSAGNDLASIFEEEVNLPKEWQILFKAHPNQNLLELKGKLNMNHILLLPNQIDTNAVLYYSDLVVGFFSSILIEAAILNKRVARYIPLNINDPFSSDQQMDICSNKKELRSLLA